MKNSPNVPSDVHISKTRGEINDASANNKKLRSELSPALESVLSQEKRPRALLDPALEALLDTEKKPRSQLDPALAEILGCQSTRAPCSQTSNSGCSEEGGTARRIKPIDTHVELLSVAKLSKMPQRASKLEPVPSDLPPKGLTRTKVAAVTCAAPSNAGQKDLEALIAEHNKKFRPKPKYEPLKYSLKDVKKVVQHCERS